MECGEHIYTPLCTFKESSEVLFMLLMTLYALKLCLIPVLALCYTYHMPSEHFYI